MYGLGLRLGAGGVMAAGGVLCGGGMRWSECWSLGRMLAGGTNIQILSSAKDLKEFWPNVGLLACWLSPVSVFVKGGARKKEKPKNSQQTNKYTYIYSYPLRELRF